MRPITLRQEAVAPKAGCPYLLITRGLGVMVMLLPNGKYGCQFEGENVAIHLVDLPVAKREAAIQTTKEVLRNCGHLQNQGSLEVVMLDAGDGRVALFGGEMINPGNLLVDSFMA